MPDSLRGAIIPRECYSGMPNSLGCQIPFDTGTFAAGLLHGTIQAPPGVNIPDVPLPVLEATDTWPPNFSDFLC